MSLFANNPELRACFESDAVRLIYELKSNLDALTTSRPAPEHIKAYQELTHTLRGAAALVEVTPVADVCSDLMRLGEIADSFKHTAWEKAADIFNFVRGNLETLLQAVIYSLSNEDDATAALCLPIRDAINERWKDYFYENNVTEAEGGFDAFHAVNETSGTSDNTPEQQTTGASVTDETADFLTSVESTAPQQAPPAAGDDFLTAVETSAPTEVKDAADDFLSSVGEPLDSAETSGTFVSSVPPAPGGTFEADLLPFFYEDALANLNPLEAALCAWEQNPGDLERLKPLHRYIHTIKGAARTTGLADIGETCNAVEDVVEAYMEQSLNCPVADVAALIRKLADAVQAAITELRSTSSLAATLENLAGIVGQARALHSGKAAAPEAKPASSELQAVDEFLTGVESAPDYLSAVGDASALAAPNAVDDFLTATAPAEATSVPPVSSKGNFESDLLPFFYEDAQANIEPLEVALHAWEENPQDAALLQAVYRHTHTIKGAANSTGLADIGRMVHSVEDVLEACVEKEVEFPPAEVATLVYQMVDAVKAGIAALQFTGAFNECLGQFATIVERAAALGDSTPQPAPMHHAARTETVAETAACTEQPATSETAGTSMSIAGESLISSVLPSTAPLPALVEASAPAEQVRSAASESPETQTIRISSQRLDAVMNLIGELIINRTRLDHKILDIARLKEDLNFCKARLLEAIGGFHERFEYSRRQNRLGGRNRNDIAALGLGVPAAGSGNTEGFSELEFDRYDEFNIMARSLVETGNDISEVIAQLDRFFDSFNEESGQFSKTTTNLQNEVTRIRMVSLTYLFRRLQRAVRDAASTEAKEVEFRIAGGETQLDKNIVDEIYSPLLHLVRNSVSHGIEPADARGQSGKAARGVVSVRAYQESNQVVIEVTDDGRGLDHAAIRATAIERGLITPDAQLTDDELTNLIFRPGFSTAKAVSQISGRGVGMDVVASTVSRLNGSIEVRTQAGKGSAFIIRLPLTLAINQAMMISVSGSKFALPLGFVEHIVPYRSEGLLVSGDRELWRTDTTTLPFVRLDRMFGLPTAETKHANVVLVRVANKALALLVDDNLTRQDIVVKPLGKLLSGIPLFSGATLSADGNVILILDLPAIEQTFREQSNAARQAATAVPTRPQRSVAQSRPRVLVADDSLSVRKVAEKYLAAIGYDAVLAVDGLDALEKLRAHGEIAAVLTDLEMPRMHGYELITEIRQSAAFRELPVIVVTSRDAEKHRKRATELGASGYITKPFTREQLAERLDVLVTANV